MIALGLAMLAGAAGATKPCLPSPCESPKGGPDYARCREAAALVATGTITDVVHHEQGPPLLKDFAEFTFTIDSWEKGAEPSTRRIRFQVGRCENSHPLPSDTRGRFRFYGPPAPKSADVPREYLYLERLPQP